MSNFRECHRCIFYSQDRSEAPKRMVKVGPDIFLHAADSQVLEQIKSGQEFRQPPENFEDVQALACYLAAEKFSEGRELAKKIAARRAPVILQSSSLVDNSNQNHLKNNPFRWNINKVSILQRNALSVQCHSLSLSFVGQLISPIHSDKKFQMLQVD